MHDTEEPSHEDDATAVVTALIADNPSPIEVEHRNYSSDKNHQDDLPKHNRDYGDREYWDERFAVEESYEWLLSYHDLARQLVPRLRAQQDHLAQQQQKQHSALQHRQQQLPSPQPRILIVGCGNAPFSADLYDAGFMDIVNVDYSATVIAAMQQKHGLARPAMQWLHVDVTQVQPMMELIDPVVAVDNDSGNYPKRYFDVVIDKAAMDAMLAQEGDVWNPSLDAIRMARAMCHNLSRILRPDGGIFVQVSLIQPHFRTKYLLGWHMASSSTMNATRTWEYPHDPDYSHEFGWSLCVEKAGKRGHQDCFGYFLYIMERGGSPNERDDVQQQEDPGPTQQQ